MKKTAKLRALLVLLLLLSKLLLSCAPTELPEADDTGAEQTDISQNEREDILLVNRWNPVPEDYTVDTRELPNKHRVAAVCYQPLLDMLAACEAAGYRAEVISGFRTLEDQVNLYDNKLNRVMAEGYSREEANEIASQEVALPGTSEHHTGYAVDIVDAEYGCLDESQELRPAQRWLLEHSAEYGFILRYPPDKTEKTGIIYEPWHYRYVGVELAQEITASGLCMEEFLEQAKTGE